jgi:DNA-binding response OmpR family regulator
LVFGGDYLREKILILDDEKEIADLVEFYLSSEGFEVFKFYDEDEAIKCIDSVELDMAILDVMLPKTSGFEICKYIRGKYNFPVIMLTAKIEQMDKINGLMLGADDYITKPFNSLEIVARVKAQIRRYKRYNNKNVDSYFFNEKSNSSDVSKTQRYCFSREITGKNRNENININKNIYNSFLYNNKKYSEKEKGNTDFQREITDKNKLENMEQEIDFSGLIINKSKHKCILYDKEIQLTPIEFKILWLLAENKGEVISSEKIFETVWGEKYFSNSNNTVMVHIRRLREKMGEKPRNPKFIKTVWGVGYKIDD